MSNPKPRTPSPEPAVEQELYAKHQKIYPREVHGIFATLRILGVLVLLGLYYLLPWFSWDGHQAVLFDLPARKFYIFGLTFWPQDFFYLAALLIIAGLSLFFFTALAGRLWCGYACPQTVWTELFLWIERKIEGDRPKQMKLAKSPWNTNKILRRGTKQTIWILLSLWTGFTFVGYFTPITELWQSILQFDLGPWETFWVFFYGFATYGNAGFMREQVCIYMCPYARFQSAMFDKDTLVISYDPNRGEPRGSRKRGSDREDKGLGDCIDCTLCVQACPTGIDIREGLQYQCIGCAACIDACDEVMDKMDYPRGLIRYTTENTLEGKTTHILRPRIIIYGLLLLLIASAVFYGIATRVPLELNVLRDRNTLYRETNQGLVENIYTLKILNMDDAPHTYKLRIEGGPPQMELHLARENLSVEGGSVTQIPVQLRIDPVYLEKSSYNIDFHLQAADQPDWSISQGSRFIGPALR